MSSTKINVNFVLKYFLTVHFFFKSFITPPPSTCSECENNGLIIFKQIVIVVSVINGVFYRDWTMNE